MNSATHTEAWGTAVLPFDPIGLRPLPFDRKDILWTEPSTGHHAYQKALARFCRLWRKELLLSGHWDEDCIDFLAMIRETEEELWQRLQGELPLSAERSLELLELLTAWRGNAEFV